MEMEQICKDHPYAINWGPVRPQTPRMTGLHPDYGSKKKGVGNKGQKGNDLD
jgi:hypothetical protein